MYIVTEYYPTQSLAAKDTSHDVKLGNAYWLCMYCNRQNAAHDVPIVMQCNLRTVLEVY